LVGEGQRRVEHSESVEVAGFTVYRRGGKIEPVVNVVVVVVIVAIVVFSVELGFKGVVFEVA